MPSSHTSLSIRIARPSDYKAVARLCRRAVGPEDYALQILKERIADRGLFLAWRNSELVGMVNFEECVDGSGWLSMGRTDPSWRRRGVAFSLQQKAASHARRRGIRRLRLWVLSNNRPSLLAAVKAGFRPICEAVHVSSSIRPKGKLERTFRLGSMYRRSLKSLLRSSYLSQMNGYFAYKWYFVKADEKLLKKLLRKGELYTDEESSFVLSRPEISFGDRYSSFALLQGSAASSLRKVKAMARGYGRLVLGCYLPYNMYLLAMARKTGFRRDAWARYCIVFEKKI
jgi:GNAT superfamily N-acetyltransferase